ncbi:MAG TPA: hypothetical protein G4O13_06520 [Dehalococcoidia bacterium]|nr:hypothetical protein [Dehalococcoidia bacterium]
MTGRPQKLAYSLGGLGYTGFYQLIGAFFIFFLVDVVRLDAWLAGLSFAISFGIWNAINDTLIGIWSDKTNTRIGRRRPWILLGIPLTLVFSVLIWTPPVGGMPLEEPKDMWIFAFATGMLFCWSWTYSMVAIPWYALLPAMWQSVRDRTEVTIWKELCAVLGGAVAIMIFPIMIVNLSTVPLSITAEDLSDGMVGVPYTEGLQAVGGTEPYTWAVEEGSTLPGGLKLDSGGNLSGIPEYAGGYTFMVEIIDAESDISIEEVNIFIREEGAPLDVSTRSLGEGLEGEEYEVVLEAFGGELPYTWVCVEKEDQCLPYGVELDRETGTISGEPTDEAEYKFTVMVTDSATPPHEATRELSIEVVEHERGSFSGWMWAGLIVSILFSVTFLISLLGVHEPKGFVLDKSWSVVRSLKTTFINKTFLSFMMINLMTWCIFGWLIGMVPFFVKHSLGLGLSDMPLLFAPTMLGIFLFFPVWRKVYIHRGPKFTLAVASIATALGFVPCLVVQNLWQGAIWAFCDGAAVGGILLARGVMTADLPDADEVATGGAKREGAYYGAIKAGEKLSFVIIGVSTSLVLSTLIGYVAGQPKPEFMDMGIRIGMVGFSALYVVILLVFLKIYPLGKEAVEEISARLQEIRESKVEDKGGHE